MGRGRILCWMSGVSAPNSGPATSHLELKMFPSSCCSLHNALSPQAACPGTVTFFLFSTKESKGAQVLSCKVSFFIPLVS